MGHKFASIAFTPAVRDIQSAQGSRAGYAGMDLGEDFNHRLGEREATFITSRDSFYIASVSETGWPYLQHRGGPAGVMKVLDEGTLGFADYSGNRQYITTGNLVNNDRVALFFMDYPNRTRLKLLGRAQVIGMDDPERIAQLEDDDYRARVERGVIIRVEAFDWNCPQHITPRYTEAEMDALIAPLREENRQLRALSPAGGSARPVVLGEGELELVVSGIRQLTPRVRAFELRAPQGGELPAVQAGAHLSVPVTVENGERVTRYYSIASNPARRDIYEIAVLREPEGAGGSRGVHATYQLGTVLRTPPPINHFALHDDNRPAVLIAGGIGITPIKAMAQALDQRGTPLQLHYAGRSMHEMAYLDRLQRQFGARMTAYPGDQAARLDIGAVLAGAPGDAMFYVCGPSRLINAVLDSAAARGIASERVRFERFKADPHLHQPLQIELARSGRVVQVAPDKSILDALLAEGVAVPHSCKAGHCRSCAVKVLAGKVEHLDSALAETERVEQRLMCPCVSRAKTDSLVLDL